MDVPGAGELSDAEYTRRLRGAGLRATRPRLLVLRLIGELGGHRSADELAAALRSRATPLPRTSVYNVVGALADRGLLMITDVGPGRALYELADRWHHHFVCRICGKIVDVPCAVGRKPCLHPKCAAGEVDEVQVIFRGRCRDCAVSAQRRRARVARRKQKRAAARGAK